MENSNNRLWPDKIVEFIEKRNFYLYILLFSMIIMSPILINQVRQNFGIASILISFTFTFLLIFFKYSIKIADFYYKDSAETMINRIISETSITDPTIKKLSSTKYRVLLGPFNDIKKLEESFNNIKLLNFENLEILKDV